VHPAALNVSDALAKQGREVMHSAGAIRQGDTAADRVYPMLQAGTARMGKEPHHSVIDPSGQAHDVRNLYIADASGFPSTSGAPFTLTIMANALRVGAEIARRGAAGEL
jgi:choline dehydrogenase-like flavoprotein